MDLLAWLTETALPLWWTRGADHAVGGFFEQIDQTGEPVRSGRRARVNTRQTYVYAEAMQRPQGVQFQAAARHGLSFLNDRFLRPDGRIRSRLGLDGEPLDDETHLYEQAFCLFALASAARAGLEAEACHDQAHVLYAQLFADWRHPRGGFLEKGDVSLQADPNMHLLEAALAWEAIEPTGPWARMADDVVTLALSVIIDGHTGAVRELFAHDGGPARGDAGRLVEPGHQFEWCWLLTRYGRLRERVDVLEKARRLYRVGRDHGVDAKRGVAFDQLWDDLSPRSRRARLWPQTEWLKAASVMYEAAEGAEKQAFADDAARAARALSLYLQTQIPGLWYDKMEPDGAFVPEPAPASSFYHIACALWAAEARGLRF